MPTRRSFCAAGAAMLAGCAATQAAPPAAAVAELAATGKLRAAINYGNPILANRGPDGQPRGVSVDLAFVAIDPVRGADMDYTAPYVIIEGAYLVRNASPLRANAEVDRPGTQVVAVSYTHLTLPTKA